MEKRLLLFFAITFIIVSLWPRLFPPAEAPDIPGVVEPVDNSATSTLPATTAPAEEIGLDPGGEKAEEEGEVEDDATPKAKQASTERTTTVSTPLYEMTLTNRGARILSYTLKQYQDEAANPYEMVGQSASKQLNVRPLDLRLGDEGQSATLVEALFELDAPASVVVKDGESKAIEFAWSDGRGLDVTKRLVIHGGTYRLGLEVSAEDGGREVAKSIVYGGGVGNEGAQSRYAHAEESIVAAGGEVEVFSASDVNDGDADLGNVTAAGVTSHYFAALMLPDTSDAGLFGSRARASTIQQPRHVAPRDGTEAEGESELIDRDVITAELLTPATPTTVILYIGPKELERLRALGHGMDQIINFGSLMRYPALMLRSWLLAIHGFVGNYGWAIVLLTGFINLLLLPLKHYSFVSMRKIQKIAPQTQKIRERYKKVKPTDPRYHEMNQEMQALYKKHGVSPVSGCLPMLLMIPFFFAFYLMLSASIELRQAPFIGWIQDLAVKDPYYVLPILMGATQLLIQKMTPQAGADPVQAKIMGFMPILFTVMLAQAPAGLVLYWFSNNLFSMAQQKATNRWLASRDVKAAEHEKAEKAAQRQERETEAVVKTGKKRKGKKGR